MNQDDIIKNYPLYYDFYPSPEVLKKLVKRMTQIKEENQENQLWQNFKLNIDPKTNEKTHTPALTIFKYKTRLYGGGDSGSDEN